MNRLSIAAANERIPALGLPELPAGESHDALSLVVRGGEVIAIVPKGTTDAHIQTQAVVVRGSLRLEDERVLTFQVTVGPEQTRFEDLSPQLHRAVHAATGAGTGASLHARDFMSREVVTISADALVEDAAKLLAYHNISGMPVEDPDGKVAGIVSEIDVIGHIGMTVDEVMSRDVISVGEDASVAEIAALMSGRRIRRVPVMRDGAVIGMVSRADIVRALASLA